VLEQGKIQEARKHLLVALHTLVIAERPIPLPVIRTQALIEEVSRQVNENKINKEQPIGFL